MEASWRRFHPDAPFRILLADADPVDRPADDPSILVPEDLGLDRAEVRTRRVIYDAFEFATSLKADLLSCLLRAGARAVLFTDGDTDLYAPLDDLGGLAADVGICLTPHVMQPPPSEGIGPGDWTLLTLGVYNTGLVAVGASGLTFLEWWADRLRRDCLDAWEDGFYVEQRWTDLAPSYFGARIVEDPTVNVAFWNLHERPIIAVDGGFEVNGQPLRHFHFSHFDPEKPWLLCPDDQPAVKGLFTDYAQRLFEAGHRRYRSGAYRWATAADGRRLTWWDRLLLREATLAHEAGAAPAPPDPFEVNQQQEFTRLLSTPIASLPLSAAARIRLRRAMARGNRRPARRRELPEAAARRLAGRWLSIERHGLVRGSADVLAEYGRPSTTSSAA